MLLLAVLPVCVDALRINQAEKQEAPTPASSTDLKRMKLNSYKSTKFQSWHEQMVKNVLGDQAKAGGNGTLREGQFACGCPVGYTYFYAEHGEIASAYCSTSEWSAEPWKQNAEKMVKDYCPNPKPNPLAPLARAYSQCSPVLSKRSLLCGVADLVVEDVYVNHKAKDDKGYWLTAYLADNDLACHWAVVPEDPKV